MKSVAELIVKSSPETPKSKYSGELSEGLIVCAEDIMKAARNYDDPPSPVKFARGLARFIDMHLAEKPDEDE